MDYDINLSPKQDSLNARNLDSLIHTWLDWCTATLPPTTMKHYRLRVVIFAEWWAAVGPWHDWMLTEELLLDFNRYLATTNGKNTKRPLTWHSQNDVIRRLRQCLHWGYERGYLAKDFANWLKAPEGSPPLRQRASLDDLRRLMEAAGASSTPVRDQALIAFFVGTGVRRAEAVALNVADVRIDADLGGTAAMRQAKRVKGRQVQGRVVAFDGWTGGFLVRLLDSYQNQEGPLFRRFDSERRDDVDLRMSTQQAYRTVRKAVEHAGLDHLVIKGPHDLRRAFATWFAVQNTGNPLAGRLLSKQLGHSTITMTDHYIWHDAEDLRSVIRSPLAAEPYEVR